MNILVIICVELKTRNPANAANVERILGYLKAQSFKWNRYYTIWYLNLSLPFSEKKDRQQTEQ